LPSAWSAFGLQLGIARHLRLSATAS